jgi:Zn-dependent protease
MGSDSLYEVSTWVLPVIIAITFHEAAHGFVAWRLGDDTARLLGRVTFNPLKHIDPFGTIVLPGLLILMKAPFLFGWAKPVPVNFSRLNHPRRDMIAVAAAGPGINLLLAVLAALLFPLFAHSESAPAQWAGENLANAVWINVILALFNLIPIPPLDGGRIAVGLLPEALARRLAKLERVGLLLLIGLLFLLPLAGRQFFNRDLNVMSYLLGGPVEWLVGVIARLTDWMP